MKQKNIIFFLAVVLIVIACIVILVMGLLQQQRLPKVALVIDDWGYNLKNIELLRSIDIPLTLSILPNLKYSKEIAQEQRFKNRQIILHMPMEPVSNFIKVEENTITTDMNKEQIADIFYRDLNAVPGAKGASNHMGSKFTADQGAMNIFLKLLKKKRLFFIDSASAKNSVCGDTASDVGVKFARRDVFLDNMDDANYIKGQLHQLIEIAERRGKAIGTGHDRKKTLEVIKELAPELKNKVRFVLVSELVE